VEKYGAKPSLKQSAAIHYSLQAASSDSVFISFKPQRGKGVKTYTVKELMVSLSDYATVSIDATLLEAVLALEKAHQDNQHRLYPHRAVLVLNKVDNVVGKVSQLDILRALEPKYDDMRISYEANLGGFTHTFIKSMLNQFNLLDKPMQDICSKAAARKVGEFMYSPSEGEFVDIDATLDEAIHQLVMGHHQSLLVTQKGKIVGILRLTDVFEAVSESVKQCQV
jgi:CBS domain-containing protein